jgi:large subunit ribosomal protein L10
MTVSRSKKGVFLEQASSLYSEYEYVFHLTYTGTSVKRMTSLRRDLKDSKVIVLKNTINAIASANTGFEGLSKDLKGQVVSVFTNDPVAVAKKVSGFIKENETSDFVGFGDKNNTFDAAYMQHVATLPGLDEVRAKIAALLKAPQTSLARIMKEVSSSLARVLKAKSEADA